MNKLKPLIIASTLALSSCASITNNHIRERVGSLLVEAGDVAPDIESLVPFKYYDFPFKKDGKKYELTVVRIPNERKRTGLTLSMRVREIGGSYYEWSETFIPYY